MQALEIDPATTGVRDRRRMLGALVALAAASGDAPAQMGGGGHHGGGQGNAAASDTADKPRAECPKAEATLPRDLMTAFAARLRDTPPDIAITPAQARAFQDFAASAAEVGQHNERWIQRTLTQSVGAVSAAEPIGAFIGSELGDGDDRQQALQDLRASYDRLRAMLDDRQRSALTSLLTATRTELRAGSAR
jgi:hypothetical protein